MALFPTVAVHLADGLRVQLDDWPTVIQAMAECDQWADREFEGTNTDVFMWIGPADYHFSSRDGGNRAAKPHLTVEVTVNGIRVCIHQPGVGLDVLGARKNNMRTERGGESQPYKDWDIEAWQKRKDVFGWAWQGTVSWEMETPSPL